MLYKFFVIIIISILSLQNCASIFSKRKFNISVNTNVPADVQLMHDVNTVLDTFTAPGDFEIDYRYLTRNQLLSSNPFLWITREGYQPHQVYIERTLNPITLWNILLFVATPFFLVDIFTGAIWKPQQNKYFIELQPDQL
jgi:hypothetical protein